MNIIQKKSPNFWSGRKGYRPEAIVIHIMDGTLIGTDSWFANPSAQVSSHYGIGKNGEVHQYVNEQDAAWHAGRVDVPSWRFIKPGINPNLYTIGIEHEGGPNDIWTDAMKQSSSTLIREICQRWQIPIDRDHIVGHFEIFSKKPNCPASNKAILDDLVALAGQQTANPSVEDGVRKIEEGLAIIKKSIF